MSLREYSVITFSGELAGRTSSEQVAAVEELQAYIKAHTEMWHDPDEDNVDKVLAKTFDDKVQVLRAFADAHGIAFQPELYRTRVSEDEKVEIETIGFKVEASNRETLTHTR